MKIGVIGGTGLYDMPGLRDGGETAVDTPHGPPSDVVFHGRLEAHELFFLARHGRGHRLLPSEINHRANIWALKSLGVERVIAVSAVGSLREELRPRDVVLPDQFFDRTRAPFDRHTFFGRGVIAHIAFGEPVCGDLRGALREAAAAAAAARSGGGRVHDGGTYVNMEGPAFSTRAEAEFHRRCGFDVIGMTGLAEAKLCREAEICYALLAFITDYDCWHPDHDSVTVDMIVGHLHANAALAQDIVRRAVDLAGAARRCRCGEALTSALITPVDRIPEARRTELRPILGGRAR